MSNDARQENLLFEAEVIRLLAAGDVPGAFALIEKTIGGKAHGYLRMATGSEIHGDELYERLRVSLLEGLPGLAERLGRIEHSHDRPLTIRAWVFRVVHNQLINWKLRKSRGNVPMLSGGIYVERGPGPVTQAIQKEQAELIRKLLADLNEDQRHIYVLHVEMELSFREAAEVLQISEDAAKMRFDRARKRLKARWKELMSAQTPAEAPPKD